MIGDFGGWGKGAKARRDDPVQHSGGLDRGKNGMRQVARPVNGMNWRKLADNSTRAPNR